MVRVELQHLRAKRVRQFRRREAIPRAARVGGVEILVRVGDEVSAVRRKGMMIECEESLFWEKALPGITFVAGLPDRCVLESNEDSRRLIKVRVLHYRCREIELPSMLHQ